VKQIVRTPLILKIPDVSLLALDKLELGAGRRGRGYYLRLISIIHVTIASRVREEIPVISGQGAE